MINWEQEQRQAPLGLIIFFAQTGRRILKAAWPLLLILIFKEKTESRDQMFFYLSIVAAVFILIASILSYWFFKFRIVDNELVVRKGYLRKVRINIPLERIQTINTKQNILQKILNLVSVEVDTAGSQGSEVEFIAVKKEIAEELEALFRSYRENCSEMEETETIEQKQDPVFKTIFQLSTSDLLKVGISQNHLKSFGAIIGFVYLMYSQLNDVFEEQIQQLTEESLLYAQSLTITYFIGFGIILLGLSLLFSLAVTVIIFFDFKLVKIERSLKVQHGLFNTREWNIPLSKIQVISLHRNPIRNLLKFSTLKIKQAVSSDNVKKKQLIWVPACSPKNAVFLQDNILEPNRLDFSEKHKPHVIYFLIRFIWTSVALLVVSLFFYDYWETWTLFLGTEIFLGLYLLLMRKRKYARLSDANLHLSSGGVSQTETWMSLYKIQSVKVKQNIFQRRRGLCSLVLYSASGDSLKVPHLPETTALEFRDYFLYQTENSHRKWM